MTISGHTGGRHGFPVVLDGDVLVPRVSTWEVEGENGYPDARVRVEIRDGRPEVVEVWVGAKADGRGIRSSDMGVFNLENLVANILAETGSKLRPNPDAEGEWMATVPGSDADHLAIQKAAHEAQDRRRQRVTTAELQAVAATYREYAQQAPLSVIAAQFGYSPRTAARRVQQARERGFLPPTTPGKVTI